MYTVTINVKFNFGDEVRFNSVVQACSGVGTIYAVTLDEEHHVDYMIKVEEGDLFSLQPGIQEDEITLL